MGFLSMLSKRLETKTSRPGHNAILIMYQELNFGFVGTLNEQWLYR